MVEKLMDVADIRFTQEHVYDTFNANSARAGGVVELINAIIDGSKTPADLPLIRVAQKQGVYWTVDNRRLFVYKHCQLGPIPVEAFRWKDNREFELKWRNGRLSRGKTGNGVRVGVIQRTEVPFPLSPIVEGSLSDIRVHLPPRQQHQHNAGIAALKQRREEAARASAASAASLQAEKATESQLLLEQLLSSRGAVAPGGVDGEGRTGRRKHARAGRLKCQSAAAEADPPAASARRQHGQCDRPGAVPKAKRRCCQSKGLEAGAPAESAVTAPLAEEAAAPQAASNGVPGAAGALTAAKLTLAMDREGSSDDEYAIEVTAPR